MHKKIDSLQLLRAVAVSLVILVHSIHFGAPILTHSSRIESFYNFSDWGTIGVDIFFTLSGFIMTIVIPSYLKPGGWKRFFVKRVIRIFPLYFLLSALDLITSIFLKHETVSGQQVLKTIFFIPIFDSKQFVSPLLSVGWSLSYEIYFYLLIGLLLAFTRKIFPTLLILIAALVGLGLLTDPQTTLIKFLTTPFLLEFGFGVVAGLFYKHWAENINKKQPSKLIASSFMVTGALALIIIIFIRLNLNIHDAEASENDTWTAFVRTMICGLPSGLLLLGVTTLELRSEFKTPKIFVLSGDASYSAYLIHMKVFPLVALLFAPFTNTSTAYLILVIPICLSVSILFYLVVERRLILIIDKLVGVKPSTVIK